MEYPTEVNFLGNTYRRYPNSKDASKRRYYTLCSGRGYKTLHRAVWEHYNGPIPKGYHIHHIDGNYFNNEPSNLACLSAKEHAAEHKEEFREMRIKQMEHARGFANVWHGSEEGIEFHRKLGKQAWEKREPNLKFSCVVCGTDFLAFFEAKYCCKTCENKVHEQRYREDACCPICGKTYRKKLYGKGAATCSRLCGASLRKQKRL